MKVSIEIKLILAAFLLWALAFNQLMAKTSGFFLEGDVKRVRITVDVQNNVILLPVRVNNSFEMNFILDTGVKTTILTEPSIMPFIRLDSLSDIKVKGLGRGEEINAKLARDVKISIPGAEGRGINMVVMPEDIISYSGMFGKPVYGIIGYDLFGQFAIEINYQQEYITLHNPFFFKGKKGKNWECLPLDIKNSKPYIHASLNDHRGESIEDAWLIDTGASSALSLFKDELPVPQNSITAFLGKGLTGEVHGHLGRNPSFSIGQFKFEEIITGYPDKASLAMFPEDLEWYGNIGSDVLSRFRVVFDYFHKKIYLKKNSDYKKPFDYNNSGLEVIGVGSDFDEFLVTYVRPNSPAADAGIKINDLLVSVNGSTVKGMTIEELYGSLIRKNGKAVRLKVRRLDEVIKTKFLIEQEI
ncbi:MAG: PDZ domain-containing protein [Bacteroidia bacterium]|nr:PDZ domain-containing protein [Bacteroidia bacterium]